jgi:hypothetical protein
MPPQNYESCCCDAALDSARLRLGRRHGLFYLITPQALLTSEPPTVPKAWWLACVPVAPMRRRRPAGCKADHAAAGERPARRRGWQP